jgi:hypothetical protein
MLPFSSAKVVEFASRHDAVGKAWLDATAIDPAPGRLSNKVEKHLATRPDAKYSSKTPNLTG